MLEIGFENTYFQVFQGFPALKETRAHIQPNGQFLAKMGKTGIFFKKAIGRFISLLKALINCKVSEKSNEGIPRKMRKTCIFGHFGLKWPILDSFWPKWAKQDFFQKSVWKIFPPISRYFRTDGRTDERGINSRFLRINIRRIKNTH